MNLPSDTPKMPKWIFLLGDAILLTVAWFIHDGADHPYAGMALISTVACVMLAVVIGVIPFVTEYARRQDEALDNRHRSLQALAVTVAAASEQVSIAATGLNGISEAAQDNYSKTERLAKEIADKVAELDAVLARSRRDDTDSVARLDVYVAKFGKVAADIEAAVAKESKAAESRKAAKAAAAAAAAAAVVVHEPAPIIASTIPEVKPAAASSDHPFAPPVAPKEPEPAPFVAQAPKPEPIPEPVPEPAPLEVAKEEAPAASVEDQTPEPVLADPVETAPPVSAPPRKRAPRKPAPEPQVVATAPDLVLEPAPADEPAPAMAQEIAEPAVSADGATRLIVTAYIGIGNRLFIRGDGPGLAWDKGVPLTFVSIGKWRWETNDATSTIRFRLFKNDTVECTTLGEASVEPGAQRELSAAF